MNDVRLDTNFVDYLIVASYFVVVLGVGFAAKRYIKSSLDYFLSGRSLPAWITGLAFISANLGATEVLGMAANGAQYGVATVNYYWLGAIPAMVFLGLVMMPFYYGSKVRSVPEYLLLRFDKQSHVFNSVTFAVATILIAGVNLFALALVLKLLLGWPIIVGIIVAAVVVAAYITLGGLSSAIYNEVLQFFVILAALIPITVIGLFEVGGWGGLQDRVRESKLGEAGLHALEGTNPGDVTNPIGATWIGLVFGLGFVLAFSYWTTNFAEVQRALSAKDLSAAERTPLIGAIPKLFLPFVMIVPGMIALVVIPGLGSDQPNMEYNNAIPLLMNEYLPNGMLGIALTGLMASFMAGVAANVSAFNTVVTTDLVEPYLKKGMPDEWYIRFGRIATIGGIFVSIFTALIASTYDNLMNYLQALFSIFNAPLFATFIIGMFWKRMTSAAAIWGLIAGTVTAAGLFIGYKAGWIGFGSDLDQSMWGAGAAFVVDAVVTVVVSLMTKPKPVDQLQGLVYGMANVDESVKRPPHWWESPKLLGFSVLAGAAILTLVFW
ncbi:sodium:solute symporter family protein [Solirubrobacter sp. CPCC 204708]|uniref:Sodium:solute symporter family protein n=1 Tax=Solirubrobacter deserti TaxID=2282478 RepID=A0ABT4RS39_9ACTN|nr:sodium:solute symporter family protein [Solirubrobacter deserti]MBE2314738.1 sodium:solute symporter family protein [Solirubrobacter deserti]MDA0141055.1 sodium:solute symporter family protein [Solirubrobacter deserti]